MADSLGQRPVRGRRLCSLFVVNLGGCSLCTEALVQLFSEANGAVRRRFDRVLVPQLADVILVTGYLTVRNMGLLDTVRQLPSEEIPVVAVGSCACRGGTFGGGGPRFGNIDRYLPVAVRVEGCPPPLEAVMQAVFKVFR
jgi:Ni,Fe-hydrogenase III small subunit